MKISSFDSFLPLPLCAVLAASATAQVAPRQPLPDTTPAAMRSDVKTHATRVEKLGTPENVPQSSIRATRPSKADSPRSIQQETQRVPAGRLYYDDSVATSLWVRGDAYKASFTTDGFTYVPFLGPRAPHNFPLSFTLEEARVGGGEIAFESVAMPVRDGQRIVYDRGTLREVYDVSASGVEQSFVFDSLPNAGEIVLRIDVQSGMQRQAHSERLAFQNEHGRVEYSRAVAIDARGERADLDTRFVGEDIEIRVPADFVARASFPLVVDPIVMTFSPSTSAAIDLVPDVSYSPATGRTAYVWETVFSATDHDVYLQLHDDGGTILFADYVDSTESNWAAPHVAYSVASQKFTTVAEVGFAGSRDIWGRTAVAGSGAQSAQFEISAGVSGDQSFADIGGDFYDGSSSNFCVVWQRTASASDTDILARVLDQNGFFQTDVIYLANSANTLDLHPAVSKGTGDSNSFFQGWNIAYENVYSESDHDIYAAQILYNGTVTTSPFVVDYSLSDDRWPSASTAIEGPSNSNPYLVAYQRLVGSDTRDIVGTVCNGMEVRTSANLSILESFDPSETQYGASVDGDGRQFHVAYMESFQGNLSDTDIYVSQFAFVDDQLVGTETHRNYAFSGTFEAWPQIAADHSSGATSRCSRTVWFDEAGGAANIEAGRYCGVVGGPTGTFCYGDGSGAACPCGVGGSGRGCPNSANAQGALLLASGVAGANQDSLALTGTGMPSNATCLYFQGTTQSIGTTFGDGLRCATGTVIRLGTKTNVGGVSSYPGAGDPSITVRGSIPSTGGRRSYQAWYRNAAAFCTPSTFNTTNGVSVVWAP